MHQTAVARIKSARQTHGDGKKRAKQKISNNTTPEQIFLTKITRRLRGTCNGSPTSVGPSAAGHTKSDNCTTRKPKHESSTPTLQLTRKTRRADTPTFHRDTPANDKTKNIKGNWEKDGFSMSMLPHCGRLRTSPEAIGSS
jgi:hypothetical protein